MSALQIKCYLLPEDCSKIVKKSAEKATEIRRFNIDRSGSGLYENLLDKILVYFKNIFENKDEIKTYYLDDEDEFIGFSSDTEFQYGIDVQLALKMSNANYNAAQNLFKVYIIKRKSIESTESSSSINDEATPSCEQQQQHCGVVCDGCNGPVIGMRYKCAICTDYDLCSTCEAKGVHKDTEHRLIKIGFPQFFKPRWGRFHRRHQRQNFQNVFGDIYTNLRTSMNKMNDPEHLKKIGEHLKGVLEPFGIDVDYYVDNVTKKNNEKPEEKPEEKQDETKMDTKQNEESKVDSLKTDSNNGIEKTTSDSSLITMDTNDKSQATCVTTSTTSTASGTTTTATTTTTTPKVFPSLNSETASASVRPHDDVDGFNMVDMEKEVKIMKAVEQLKEMGFDDQNNWLTSLVTSKDGNINAVLDALSPFAFKY